MIQQVEMRSRSQWPFPAKRIGLCQHFVKLCDFAVTLKILVLSNGEESYTNMSY